MFRYRPLGIVLEMPRPTVQRLVGIRAAGPRRVCGKNITPGKNTQSAAGRESDLRGVWKQLSFPE